MKRLSSRSWLLIVPTLLSLSVKVAHSESTKTPNAPEPAQDLYGIVVALLQYTCDADDTLPPMQNTVALRKLLWPYCHDEAIFTNSQTGDAYQPNVAVSQQKLATLKDKQVVLFYEPRPASDGKRWVLFLPKADKHGDFDLRGTHDDYVKQVTASEWRKLQVELKNE